jgi:hypothetical protein
VSENHDEERGVRGALFAFLAAISEDTVAKLFFNAQLE